ncbi:MAG TPA: ATP-binding protein [Burkholderiaceae bacterium]|nr:ATP-binding protein [Burkholderiaceae bacterium]
MIPPVELVLELSSDVSELARLAEAVDSFGAAHALPARLVFNLNLVLEEVVVNVMHYAFADTGAHSIHVRLRFAGRRVEVEVRDAGNAFDPLSAPVPDLSLDLEQRQVGGLGVHFLRTLMDEVRYERRDGENRLYFCQALPAAAGG